MSVRGNAFDAALFAFGAAWEGAYGVTYVATASDRANLGRMLATLERDGVNRDELPGLFRAYLRDKDSFIVEKHRHSLTWFCTKGNGLNKYRTRPNGVAVRGWGAPSSDHGAQGEKKL